MMSSMFITTFGYKQNIFIDQFMNVDLRVELLPKNTISISQLAWMSRMLHHGLHSE